MWASEIGVFCLVSGIVVGIGHAISVLQERKERRRKMRQRRRAREEQHREFERTQREIKQWYKEQEQAEPKKLNVICKNPAMLPAWQ